MSNLHYDLRNAFQRLVQEDGTFPSRIKALGFRISDVIPSALDDWFVSRGYRETYPDASLDILLTRASCEEGGRKQDILADALRVRLAYLEALKA